MKKIYTILVLTIISIGNIGFTQWKPIFPLPYSWLFDNIYELSGEEDLWIKEEQPVFDFYSDTSIQKFLDDQHWLSSGYDASDIVQIRSDFTTNDPSKFYLREEAADAFAWLAWAFSSAFDYKARLTINSARRSQGFQRKLLANCEPWRCAKPWTSEHEAWLALDLWVNWWNIKAWSWRYYDWLYNNAHLYWFHNTYQKGIDIDWKIIEPWHRRYVWAELATLLYNNQQTLAEYFYYGSY